MVMGTKKMRINILSPDLFKWCQWTMDLSIIVEYVSFLVGFHDNEMKRFLFLAICFVFFLYILIPLQHDKEVLGRRTIREPATLIFGT